MKHIFYLFLLVIVGVVCLEGDENDVYWKPSSSKVKTKPGLLLNMLTRDEAVNLERTLPKWAKIIDYWVIGLDVLNTDNSEEIIEKHLGHLPGKMVYVNFTGMGPTWSILVEEGIKSFPECSHGIISDADFIPVSESFNRNEFDPLVSKYLFKMWTDGQSSVRNLDWIYRNIPGAKVERRVHQILTVPPIEGQDLYVDWCSLEVEDSKGGFMDRTGKRSQKYIYYLELDLEDHPGDARTLYYLAHAHYEFFTDNQDNPSQIHWDHLDKALHYFQLRSEISTDNEEGRWFSILLMGEINERFLKKWDPAMKHYLDCLELDPERAEPTFYIGQHYRLMGEYKTAEKWLRKSLDLPFPPRSLFNWKYLYSCLRYIEYGRTVKNLELSKREIKKSIKYLKNAQYNPECEQDYSTIVELKNDLTSKFPFFKLNKLIKNIDSFTRLVKNDVDKKMGTLLRRRSRYLKNSHDCTEFNLSKKKYLEIFDGDELFNKMKDLNLKNEVNKMKKVLKKVKSIKCTSQSNW
ncbi:tpr repeat-containing protein [Anaeramoeba flamelloides]|uniref:Tpr repeat-containing protein n=1 Tax=Anaeramoeba flamelloides TaxID=1746091 RepID=A0ABQ8XE97_9EUKA|nr:tpr repeat-containing protein [Anaeramoeba flamelloides]